AWSLSDERDTRLTLASIDRAEWNRGCHRALVFHSARGVEYLAGQYLERLHRYGIGQSMNRPKTINENAYMESFCQQFKTERIKSILLKTVKQLRGMITEYVRYRSLNGRMS